MTLEKYYEWLMPDDKKLNLEWIRPPKSKKPKRFAEFRYRKRQIYVNHLDEYFAGQYIGISEDGYLEIGYIENNAIYKDANFENAKLTKFGCKKYANCVTAILHLFAEQESNKIFFAFHTLGKYNNNDTSFSFYENCICWINKKGEYQTLWVPLCDK